MKIFKMKRHIGLLILALLFVSACKEKKEELKGSSQMETVMAIHDNVMPKMGKLGKLVAELNPKVDSTEIGQQYGSAVKDLQNAHESMMTWMKDFGERFDHDEIMNGATLTPQKKEWLNEEEEKVKVLREQINSSIARAEALLKE